MKRKTVCILATGLIIAALTGCGTKAEATDQAVENGGSNSETVVKDNDEILTSEVVGEETEAVVSDFAGAENEDIVLYAEIAKYGEYSLNLFNFGPAEEVTVIATSNIPVYCYDGIEVGYIKAGAEITLTERGENSRWSRFENPVSGTDYDYLYVFDDDYAAAMPDDKIHLDAESMKQAVIDYINNGDANIDEVDYVILDAKASDMETLEVNMPSAYDTQVDIDSWLSKCFYSGEVSILNYQTLYVECEDDVDGWITVTIGYKDKIEWRQY